MNKLIISCLFFIFYLAGFSQQRFFSGYSISDGLSQSVVNCIYQDSRGFMWFGTQNGLNKFDGYTFEVFIYKPNDTTSISNNWIFSITEDHQGNLWVGTKGGLNRFITKEKRFERIQYSTPYPYMINNYIYDVKCAKNGNILINTPPVLSVCDPGSMSFTHYTSPLSYHGSVKDWNIPLMEDNKGRIWTGSSRGLAYFLPDSGKFEIFNRGLSQAIGSENVLITALFQDREGNIWIGTPNGLIWFMESKNIILVFRNDMSDEFRFSNNFIRAIQEDKAGNIWFATEGGGLNILKKRKESKFAFESFSSENSNLLHNIVMSLYIDRTDNLWIGTLSGLNRTDLKRQKFNLYRKSDTPHSVDLLGNVIASLYKDKDGLLWVGNWGQGLNLYDRKTGKVEHYSSNKRGKYYIPDNYIHTIFKDSIQTIWVGTRDGLVIWQEKSRSFIRPHQFAGNPGLPDFQGLRIFMMMQSRDKDYWIATQDGLYRKSHSANNVERFYKEAPIEHQISGNLVYAVLEDRDRLIWIGTTEGLDCYNPVNKKISHFRKTEDSLSDDFITALCEDNKGNIWIGTSSYIDRFSKKDSSFTYFSQEHGLPGNLIYSIQKDKKNGLWFATGNGLCRFDTTTQAFRAFSVDEGLQSPEFNLRASFVSDDGEVFFGGMNGLNAFYPDSLRNNPHIPAVVITSAFKMKKGIKEYINLEKNPDIVLPYDENSLTIEFSALEFTNPARNNYRYRFEGIDEDWIDIGNRHFISLSNLSSGEYLLSIKGSNNDGIWNEEGTSVKIVIKPPWWSSNMAYILYLLITVLLVYIIFKNREKKHVKDKKILEDKVRERTFQIEEQKTEILRKNQELNELNASKDKFFSIIAHDLRNPFNTIIGLTEVLLMNLDSSDKEKMRKSLENIKESSHQAHELLENLLLWARSHTGMLHFHPETTNLKTLAEESMLLVNAHAIRKNITLSGDNLQDVIIPVDVNMVRTILRNLLTNALKFTQQNGNVRIGLSENDGFGRLVIRDDGVGIDRDKLKTLFNIDSTHKTKGTDKEPGTGLGLILCGEFVSRHGGRIEVESEPGKGSEFRIYLPVDRQVAEG